MLLCLLFSLGCQLIYSIILRSSDQSNAPTNTPGEGLDRYGMPSGDRTGPVDIFGELDRPVSQASSDHSTSADPATEMNKSAATAFLPYCLATDPVANRKTVIKPFSVKVYVQEFIHSRTSMFLIHWL